MHQALNCLLFLFLSRHLFFVSMTFSSYNQYCLRHREILPFQSIISTVLGYGDKSRKKKPNRIFSLQFSKSSKP